jgi:hypothetical protein
VATSQTFSNEAVFAGQRDDRIARDALQDRIAKRRRVDHAIADEEQVLAGAFADAAVRRRGRCLRRSPRRLASMLMSWLDR